MAYRSARTARGSSRGGSSARGGGGGNGPMILAAIVVLGLIVLLIVLLVPGKKPPPPAPPPAPDSGPVTLEKPPEKKAEPPPVPYPPVDPKRIEELRAKVKEFDPLITKGQALYDEAMKFKRDGKDAEWQAKLKEAIVPFDQVLDEWNEITASLPTSSHYDADAVASHYLGKEGNKVNKALETRMAIKKAQRLGGS